MVSVDVKHHERRHLFCRDLALLTSALGSLLHRTFRAQELCESLAAMAVPSKPFGFCGRKAPPKKTSTLS